MSGGVRHSASRAVFAVLACLVVLVWLGGPAHAAPLHSAAGPHAPSSSRTSVRVVATTATVARATTVTVTVSRGRIAGLQFVTDGLTAAADWTYAGHSATGTVTWHTIGTGRITVKVTLASGRVVTGTAAVPVEGDATIDASLPRYQLIYVYPADRAPVDGRARAIAHEAQIVDQWFAGQLGGSSPRFALNLIGEPSVVTVAAPIGASALATSSDIAADLVQRWRTDGVIAANTIPIVYVDGTQTRLPEACGWYETPVDVIVMPLGNCAIEPTEQTVFPYNSTAILAHEIVHSLGALSQEAAQPDGSGRHTTDDPSDIMYDGPKPHDWQNLTLDPGKDDYVGSGSTPTGSSGGIETSPLLEHDDGDDEDEQDSDEHESEQSSHESEHSSHAHETDDD